MTHKIHDLCIVTGSYTDAEGKNRNRYQTIGAMLEKDDGGRFIIMEPWFNPAGVHHEQGKGIMVSMFDAKPRDGKAPPNTADQPAPPPPAGADDFSDDIPF